MIFFEQMFGQMLHFDGVAVSDVHSIIHHVEELSDVTRPGVALEEIQNLRSYFVHLIHIVDVGISDAGAHESLDVLGMVS